jgi:hypothetical protein
MKQLETSNTAGDTRFHARQVVDRGLRREGTSTFSPNASSYAPHRYRQAVTVR